MKNQVNTYKQTSAMQGVVIALIIIATIFGSLASASAQTDTQAEATRFSSVVAIDTVDVALMEDIYEYHESDDIITRTSDHVIFINETDPDTVVVNVYVFRYHEPVYKQIIIDDETGELKPMQGIIPPMDDGFILFIDK